MCLAGRNGDDIIGGIAAFDTEHSFIAVLAEVAHLGGGFLLRVPHYGGMAAAFVNDDVTF